ncbi:hypothetical protein CK203_074358 [Vitis vinifera]|uniref:Uncharacterized protein n=1 Tax=Vitis vinifera TaxID=29760 RepID=A0A438BYS3_VITVI|nr:hypothetical protein CK203_074358 [Vitis vinifera]
MSKMALWIELKSEKFFVKSLYVALEPGSLVPFLMSIIWSSCVSPKLYSCMFLAGCRVNANDDLLHSKEMLAMLYCMAIMR